MLKDKNKPQILILRGKNLNPFEMQNYFPLMDEFQLQAVVPKKHRYNLDSIPFSVNKTPDRKNLLPLRKWQRFVDKYWINKFYDFRQFCSQIDLVHSAETFNWYTRQILEVKEKFGYKVILTCWENIPFLEIEAVKQKRLTKDLAKQKVDYIIATSQRAKDSLILEGFSPSKIEVIMPGIDLEKFKPRKKDQNLMGKLNLEKKDIVILSISRLVWEKGVYDLLFSAKKLAEDIDLKNKSLKFILVGKGPEKRRLTDLINKLKIQNIFIICDFVPYQDIPRFHNLADIFVLNSIPKPEWQEQFGMVFIESMASGKAVIAGKSGSIPEVIGLAGELSQPADYSDLTDKIKNLVLDTKRREDLGKKAHERAINFFDSQKVSEKIRNIYHKNLKNF